MYLQCITIQNRAAQKRTSKSVLQIQIFIDEGLYHYILNEVKIIAVIFTFQTASCTSFNYTETAIEKTVL